MCFLESRQVPHFLLKKISYYLPTTHNVRRPLPYIIMLLSWKIWSIQFQLQQMTILYVTVSTSPKDQTLISWDAVFQRKGCFCSHSCTEVRACLVSLLSRLYYGHLGTDLAEKSSPKRTQKKFQHSGIQPWLSSIICCNTLSNLFSQNSKHGNQEI